MSPNKLPDEQEQLKFQMQMEREQINSRMSRIKHKILVLSGKGGVGKSTVAVNLAVALAGQGEKVGLLDTDIHGPSVPKILSIEGSKLMGTDHSIMPFQVSENLSAMSVGFMLQHPDSPVVWRGPMKYNMIKQFVKDVEWDDLDYLIVDSPPGTGDEPLATAQLIEQPDGAVIVTTPQQVAITDVRKSVLFCRQLELPVLGVIENMSGFVCPDCNKQINIFRSGGGEAMALEMNIPFLGRVPLDPQIVAACDSDESYVENYQNSVTAEAFESIVNGVVQSIQQPD